MRSPTIVGDPCPRPGIGVFQTMFSVSLQWVGGFWPEAAMPSRVGPRHAGQSKAGSTAAASALRPNARVPPTQSMVMKRRKEFRRLDSGWLGESGWRLGFTAEVCAGSNPLSSEGFSGDVIESGGQRKWVRHLA